MYQTLEISEANNILTVTINRPDKLNALNQLVIRELGMAIHELNARADLRGAIITGKGNKAFVAGADISGFAGLTQEQGLKLAQEGMDVFFSIEQSAKPVIAAVNGFALGGGCELAMACHFRICSEQAQFGQPEVNLGLIPGYGGTQRLPALIGKGRAMEYIMTGNLINATLALQFGLVNYVTPAEELLPKTLSLLQLILTRAPLAIAKSIASINAFMEGAGGYALETKSFGECFATADMKEGTQAFLEKRKPVFRGV